MKYRLGLDLGTNSIGWAVYSLDTSEEPLELVDLGVRIFSDGRDPKTKEPLAVARNGTGSAKNYLPKKTPQKGDFQTFAGARAFPKDKRRNAKTKITQSL